MTTQTIFTFTCDLCNREEKSQTGEVPKNWLNMLIEDKYLDREFTEKHICDECCLDIKKRNESQLD